MSLLTTIDREAAVVAVEPALDSVRRREDRRDDLEGIRRVVRRASGEHVVGVGVSDGWLAVGRRARVRRGRRRARREAACGCRVLVRDSLAAVVANAVPVALDRALVGGGM